MVTIEKDVIVSARIIEKILRSYFLEELGKYLVKVYSKMNL